jgi:protoporphyrinogen oxidase
MHEQQQKHQDVLIIGGGLAWLPAAVTLLERNRDFQVTLLEAKDRLGGRLHTVSPDTR